MNGKWMSWICIVEHVLEINFDVLCAALVKNHFNHKQDIHFNHKVNTLEFHFCLDWHAKMAIQSAHFAGNTFHSEWMKSFAFQRTCQMHNRLVKRCENARHIINHNRRVRVTASIQLHEISNKQLTNKCTHTIHWRWLISLLCGKQNVQMLSSLFRNAGTS